VYGTLTSNARQTRRREDRKKLVGHQSSESRTNGLEARGYQASLLNPFAARMCVFDTKSTG
jgi:hypothetical protein